MKFELTQLLALRFVSFGSVVGSMLPKLPQHLSMLSFTTLGKQLKRICSLGRWQKAKQTSVIPFPRNWNAVAKFSH